MNTAKQYILYINDHTGSMSGGRARGALADFNANIAAVKTAASRELLNTVVSVIAIGMDKNERSGHVSRQLVVSNPHVLAERTTWPTPGGCTPLWDAILDGAKLHEALPDIDDPDTTVLVMLQTDGGENGSYARLHTVADKIDQLQRTGRWTFVFRIPKGTRSELAGLPVPAGNIQEWETTEAGMRASTVQTTAAMDSYMTARAKGTKSTNVFYTSTAAVDTSKLVDIKNKTSLYIVDPKDDGIMVKDFILQKRTEYLVGAAFYQLVKTEARVQPNKLLLIRDRQTGAVYAGTEARSMLGLDTYNNARVHPNHGNGNYDIFIQSTSVNRKLPANSGVLYWAEKGRPMTAEDMKYLLPKTNGAPAVPQMMQAPATGKPTPSPIAKTPAPAPQAFIAAKTPTATYYGGQVNGKPVAWFAARDAARVYARQNGLKSRENDGRGVNLCGPNGERWFVYLA